MNAMDSSAGSRGLIVLSKLDSFSTPHALCEVRYRSITRVMGANTVLYEEAVQLLDVFMYS